MQTTSEKHAESERRAALRQRGLSDARRAHDRALRDAHGTIQAGDELERARRLALTLDDRALMRQVIDAAVARYVAECDYDKDAIARAPLGYSAWVRELTSDFAENLWEAFYQPPCSTRWEPEPDDEDALAQELYDDQADDRNDLADEDRRR